MPVVLTDFTNKTWCVEQPTDGYLHVGWVGKSGPRLLDVLEFVLSKQDQFDKFIQKKREEEVGIKNGKRRRTAVSKPEPAHARLSESGGPNGPGKAEGSI